MAVQNLRVYERRGLIEPARTPGGTRLYSHDDLQRLVRIRDLLTEGLNLAGIRQGARPGGRSGSVARCERTPSPGVPVALVVETRRDGR